MNIILPCENLKTKDFRIKDGILYLRYGQSFQNTMYSLTYFMKGKNFCYYCKSPIPRDEITMDHMYPRSVGGPTIPQNLIPSCKRCNSQKSDMTFEQYKTYLSLGSASERSAYVSKINNIRERIRNAGLFDLPVDWVVPIATSTIRSVIDSASISATKFQKCKLYYETYHCFQNPIILDRNLFTLDGFYMYLVARYFEIEFVPAIVLDNVEVIIRQS